jgi:hypothetical protein
MLSAAFALVLSQTPAADKPPMIFHDAAAAKANCPSSGAVIASDPAIARPDRNAGPRGGFPDMVHMPQVYVVSTVVRTVQGCNAPLIRNVLFTGKRAATDAPAASPAKPAH